MYVNRDSEKLFEKQHARDRMVELAHHLTEEKPDADVFLGHSRAAAKGSALILLLAAIMVIAALAYFAMGLD